jgi:PAS domain S-box-containing protein
METRQIQDEHTITADDVATDTHNRRKEQTTEQPPGEMRTLRTRIAALERLAGKHEMVEQALINALQEWESTFNATKDSIMLVDKECRIVQANHSASRFFGKPLGKILGQTTLSLLYGTVPPPDNCPLMMTRQTNKHEEAELYIPQKDTWVALSADPVIDDEENTQCFVHIIRDITYRKKTEQILAKLNQDLHKTVKELKHSNRELQSFAHVIAHDLKSPLRGIGSIADRLIRKYPDKLDDEGKEQFRLMLTRVKRMSEFIDGILRYSAIGQGAEEQQNVDVSSLVAEIIGEIAVPDHFEIVVQHELPTIRCNRLRLKQVFQNLISNAVRYTNKPKAQIRIGCTE